MRRTYGAIRFVAAAGIVVAIVGQLVYSLSLLEVNTSAFLWNFFSFFTVLSNCLAAVVLVFGAWYCFRMPADPPWFNLAHTSVVTYMVTTGIVYNLLLRNISLDQGTTLGWSNEILHVWAPLYLLADWLFAAGRSALLWRRLWVVVLFPVAWAIYTMIRGGILDWYPYPFLNPAQPAGYIGVVLHVLLITVVILAIAAGLFALSRVRALQPPD
ncbi:Pr6Pr family membrane protein [Glaciibacter psychrotolerans]|uniref:Pr6Pr family membrane protein n=1 Tax=Glaciibacter psychrotolerans TaxID=670054 RepID=A0A7Z0EGT4_9MICO|nr:hypothetical protein [Leifsonia psychrotolerans]